MYVHDDYVQAIELLESKKVRLAPLITNEFPLEKIAEAYSYIDAHRDDVQKVILKV
jgi:threonine dehydrogenase-like Zn-dependent dehydrogenase